MAYEPVHKRHYHAFLSHASKDKADIINPLFQWLTEVAGIPIWYDREELPGGVGWRLVLENGLMQSRSLLIVYTEASLKSGWVEQEYDFAFRQKVNVKNFRIVGVSVDGSRPSDGFLGGIQTVAMPDGKLTLEFCENLLRALYHRDIDLDPEMNPERAKDLYISRTWRESEAPLADFVCHALMKARFRLIGDAPDQDEWDEGRIRSIISSCRGLVAILPDRGEGETSDFMIRELEIARKAAVPYAIVAEPTVKLTSEITESALELVRLSRSNLEAGSASLLAGVIESLRERSKPPAKPHYVFFATDLDPKNKRRNAMLKNHIQRITSMQCMMGAEIRGTTTHEEIARRIRSANLFIADVTEDSPQSDGSPYAWNNPNICVEVGIAWGANVDHIELIGRHDADEPVKPNPAYMLSNREVADYQNDIDLIGLIHKIAYPYRRRVLNYELILPK